MLAHLPLAAKLWLGFGLVLLSTLGVATIGFQSIGLLQARITHAVSSIERMNQQIAGAAHQQSVTAEQVSSSMERLSRIADGNAQESGQLQASTAELQEVGVRLNAAVGHFRV